MCLVGASRAAGNIALRRPNKGAARPAGCRDGGRAMSPARSLVRGQTKTGRQARFIASAQGIGRQIVSRPPVVPGTPSDSNELGGLQYGGCAGGERPLPPVHAAERDGHSLVVRDIAAWKMRTALWVKGFAAGRPERARKQLLSRCTGASVERQNRRAGETDSPVPR